MACGFSILTENWDMTSADVRSMVRVEVVFDEGTIYRDLVQSGVEQMTVPGMLWKFKKICQK